MINNKENFLEEFAGEAIQVIGLKQKASPKNTVKQNNNLKIRPKYPIT